MTAKSEMREYPPEIDGLRAFAVVVLFYFQVPGFQGGFIGVDIFFVVNGFLITRNILTENERGRLTRIGFYVRPIRRDVPSLIAISIAVIILRVCEHAADDVCEYSTVGYLGAVLYLQYSFLASGLTGVVLGIRNRPSITVLIFIII